MADVDVSLGARAWLYHPEGATSALGSNRLEEQRRYNPRSDGGSFWKLTGRGHCGGLGGTMVGPASTTWQPLKVCHGMVSFCVL
jgi:hypothetical protein